MCVSLSTTTAAYLQSGHQQQLRRKMFMEICNLFGTNTSHCTIVIQSHYIQNTIAFFDQKILNNVNQ